MTIFIRRETTATWMADKAPPPLGDSRPDLWCVPLELLLKLKIIQIKKDQ